MLVKLVLVSTLLAICTAQRLNVAVYYESLCPDSARFIVEQVQPLMRGPLGKYVDVTLVPFGKANYSTLGSDVQFTCQHGPNECYGNKVHACALEHIQVDSYQNTQTRASLSLDYVACLLKYGLPSNGPFVAGPRCAIELQLKNWKVIEQCANTTEGSKILQHQGELTHALRPEVTEVPWININQQHDSEVHQLATRDLRAAVCRSMRSPRPQECSNLPGAAISNTAGFVTMVVSATAFMLAKLF